MEPLLQELRPRPVAQGVQRQPAVRAGQRVAHLQPAALRGRHHPLHQGSVSPAPFAQSRSRPGLWEVEVKTLSSSSSTSLERNA